MILQQIGFLSQHAAVALAAADTSETAGGDVVLGLGVMVLGLAVVFTGLISLIIITALYPKIIKGTVPRISAWKAERKAAKDEKKRARQQLKAVSASAKNTESITADKTGAAVSEETDEALIAVITAAVAASLGTSTNGIVIRSLRRAQSNMPAWGTSGRIEQVTNRL